jgi:hypothetical protein
MSLQPQNLDVIPELTVQVARAAFPQGCECMLIRDQLAASSFRQANKNPKIMAAL